MSIDIDYQYLNLVRGIEWAKVREVPSLKREIVNILSEHLNETENALYKIGYDDGASIVKQWAVFSGQLTESGEIKGALFDHDRLTPEFTQAYVNGVWQRLRDEIDGELDVSRDEMITAAGKAALAWLSGYPSFRSGHGKFHVELLVERKLKSGGYVKITSNRRWPFEGKLLIKHGKIILESDSYPFSDDDWNFAFMRDLDFELIEINCDAERKEKLIDSLESKKWEDFGIRMFEIFDNIQDNWPTYLFLVLIVSTIVFWLWV